MKPLLLLSLTWVAIASSALATDSYEYKPGEYLLIDHGLAPNKKLALYAGSEKGFSIFLFERDGKAKKKIGPLDDIAEPLDTGAQSFHAFWSPDSRHVVVTYRIDRHWLVAQLYRIEGRRAYPVRTPWLIDEVLKDFDRDTHEMGDNSHSQSVVTWKSPTQFILTETRDYYHVHENPEKRLGKFGKVENLGDTQDKSALSVAFSAVALCELAKDDSVKILELKPGKFED